MTNDTSGKSADKNFLKAVRLINIEGGKCAFQIGRIPVRQHINVNQFFAQTEVDAYEMVPHPAPRRQYVITLKGRLEFKVSSGETFIVEPGIVLIAADTIGEGHSWKLIEGEEWQRLYLPLDKDANDFFIADFIK